jgi:hypothetical protein
MIEGLLKEAELHPISANFFVYIHWLFRPYGLVLKRLIFFIPAKGLYIFSR